MSAKVIAIANQKGGVGKSTTTIQTCFWVAADKEKASRILVIDMDPQGNTSSRLARQDPNLLADYSGTLTFELFNEVLEEIRPVKGFNGIDVICARRNDPDLHDIESMPLGVVYNPAKHIQKILDKYDYVFIDCPPGLGRRLVASMVLATHVVIPVKLSGFAIEGVEDLVRTILGVQSALNPKLKIAGLYINDLDGHAKAHAEDFEKLQNELPGLVLKKYVTHRTSIDRATSIGVPIWSFKDGASRAAGKELREMITEMLERCQ